MQDYTDDLAAVENSLRRIIERVGHDAHEDTWLSVLAPSFIKKWEGRRDKELAVRGNGIQEQRVIYFSDFNDLIQVLTDNWTLFEPVFGDQTQTTVYLEKLRELRNPDAHSRELTQAEKYLIIGMASELRTKITRYMAVKDTPDEYFPRIESIRDSLGNIKNKPANGLNSQRPVIRVGDTLEFIVEAWDPEGKELEFYWYVTPQSELTNQNWSTNNRFTWCVKDNQIAKPATVGVRMRGLRPYHADGDKDDFTFLEYVVLPAR